MGLVLSGALIVLLILAQVTQEFIVTAQFCVVFYQAKSRLDTFLPVLNSSLIVAGKRCEVASYAECPAFSSEPFQISISFFACVCSNSFAKPSVLLLSRGSIEEQ